MMSSINTISSINKYIINLSTPCSWVHLTLVFTLEIRYLRSSILIINYPTLSAAIWGYCILDDHPFLGSIPNVECFEGFRWFSVFMEYQHQFLLDFNRSNTVGFVLKMQIWWLQVCIEWMTYEIYDKQRDNISICKILLSVSTQF